MPSHQVSGFTRVAGQPVARRVDVVEAAQWAATGLESAVVGTTVSSALDGSWEIKLESDDLVYVFSPPVAPYEPLMLGPFRPEPI